jgi:penicillin-binding protein 1C
MKAAKKFCLKFILSLSGIVLVPGLLLIWRTSADLRPFPDSLSPDGSKVQKVRVLDRHGSPLSTTYQNQWNLYDVVPLGEVPQLLQQAFIEAEDRRFYAHSGVDWPARCHALLQNLFALRVVRGASTITEQAVRMLHPRPRTFWSRWLEGIEAARLEERFSKAEILEFYLNQVPFSHQRRGIIQASHYYFDRDPDTLSTPEMLRLAVLVRAPGALDPRRNAPRLHQAVMQLAVRLQAKGLISEEEYRAASEPDGSLGKVRAPIEAGHFVGHLHRSGLSGTNPHDPPDDSKRRNPLNPHLLKGGTGGFHTNSGCGRLVTTIDGPLQVRVQAILDSRLRDLRKTDAVDGGVLVVDHERNEVLAWVNGGGLTSIEPGGWIDAVTMPRQPGSTLKPFLYALALDKGWTAATLINDSPLAEPIRLGLHSFHNYSRTHYGPLRLREALGNSLNIPAVRTLQFIGVERFLQCLHNLGFQSLRRSAYYYGEGLALGDGEVTLLELVQAYTVLAREGEFRPLKLVLLTGEQNSKTRRVFDKEVSSLVADILSDPRARRLEFGEGHLLRFPVRTAVKTGTSSDYRDAWAVGFSGRYTAGVWMGKMDRRPMDGVTGSSGPGLVLRAVFAELNRYQEPEPFALSRRLTPASICRISGQLAGAECPSMQEWFQPGTLPRSTCRVRHRSEAAGGSPDWVAAPEPDHLQLLQPTPGLLLAMDPHIPDDLEAFSFIIPEQVRPARVEWLVDGSVSGVTGTDQHRYLWPLAKGRHVAQARVWPTGSERPVETPAVMFTVR